MDNLAITFLPCLKAQAALGVGPAEGMPTIDVAAGVFPSATGVPVLPPVWEEIAAASAPPTLKSIKERREEEKRDREEKRKQRKTADVGDTNDESADASLAGRSKGKSPDEPEKPKEDEAPAEEPKKTPIFLLKKNVIAAPKRKAAVRSAMPSQPKHLALPAARAKAAGGATPSGPRSLSCLISRASLPPPPCLLLALICLCPEVFLLQLLPCPTLGSPLPLPWQNPRLATSSALPHLRSALLHWGGRESPVASAFVPAPPHLTSTSGILQQRQPS